MNIGEKFMNRKPNNEFEDIENSVKFEKLINKYYKEKWINWEIDCLQLNVISPSARPAQKKGVFIYGE